MNKRIRYVQLKPSPEQVLTNLPWTGRKRPYILITFQDGSTKSITIKHVDLRAETRKAIAVAEKALRKIQGDIALDTFKLDEYFPKHQNVTLGDLREIYLEHREKEVSRGKISKNTFESNYNYTKLFVKMVGNEKLIARITPGIIQDFV